MYLKWYDINGKQIKSKNQMPKVNTQLGKKSKTEVKVRYSNCKSQHSASIPRFPKTLKLNCKMNCDRSVHE